MLCHISKAVDLDDMNTSTAMDAVFTVNDPDAHTLEVTVLESGLVPDLTDYQARLYRMDPDDVTAIVNAAIAGNVITAQLPVDTMEGPHRAVLRLFKTGGEIVTLLMLAYTVNPATEEDE